MTWHFYNGPYQMSGHFWTTILQVSYYLVVAVVELEALKKENIFKLILYETDIINFKPPHTYLMYK